jgi:dihydropyrimidinase
VRAIADAECELVVRGGTVVTAGSSSECDLGISAGRITQIGGFPRGRTEIDASDALVLPGGLDMHVHLTSPVPPEPGIPAWVDDFSSGSAAAIAGGVTTIGNMTFPAEGQSLRQALARDLSAAHGTAAVDYVLHPAMYDRSSTLSRSESCLAGGGERSSVTWSPGGARLAVGVLRRERGGPWA